MQKIGKFSLLLTIHFCMQVSGYDWMIYHEYLSNLASYQFVVLKDNSTQTTLATDGFSTTFVRYIGSNGWLVVDLGWKYIIWAVAVLPPNCCDRAMDFFKVGLHKTFDESTFKPNQLCGSINKEISAEQFSYLDCNKPLQKVRYVSLNADVLSVAEFRVYGINPRHFKEYYHACYVNFGEGLSFKVNSITECIYTCLIKQEYNYAGVTKGGDCLCDNVVENNVLPSSECNIACSDDAQFCGGSNSFSVYRTHWCTNIWECGLHCLNGERLGVSGKCDNGCEAGWRDSRCFIRNCSSNNGGCGIHKCTSFSNGMSELTECVCNKGYKRTRIFSSPCKVLHSEVGYVKNANNEYESSLASRGYVAKSVSTAVVVCFLGTILVFLEI